MVPVPYIFANISVMMVRATFSNTKY
jgi:hypothetical protein